MADGYNLRGNPLSNFTFDKFLKPHKKEEEGQRNPQIPAKPEGMNELPPNINMTAAPIKNLSDMKRKTPQEQYEHNVQMKNPASAYARKEKEDLKNLTEAAKEAGVLKDDGANTMNISFDNADLASQTPAGEASAGEILPGNDYVNPAETSNGTSEGKSEIKSESNTESKPESKPSEIKPEESKPEGKSESNPEAKKQEAKAEAKQESRYKIRSIMDAYNEGILDEKSRDYLIVDTLSKFARNMGKDISNIGAAYTGGSQNNEREDSIWSKRNEEMAGRAIGAEGNKLRSEDNYDLDYQSQKLDLAKKRIQMVPAQNFQRAADEMRNAGNKTGAAIMDLIASASTQSVDPEEYIASLYATDPNVKELVDNSMGAISNIAGVLGDLTGDVEELLKSARGKAGDSANKSIGRRIADAAFQGHPLYNMATNYLDKQ